MKKWLYILGVITAIGILARLPHPARDISRLVPVELVYVYETSGEIWMETDTGDQGCGKTLAEAARDLRARSDGEIFLETAEYLLLGPGVPLDSDLYDLLRPDCGVFFTLVRPDLTGAAKYLSVHPPENTLAEMRTQGG